MKSLYSFVSLVLPLAVLFVGSAADIDAKTQSFCYTKRTSKSVNPVPTTTKAATVTIPILQIQTSTPSFTITSKETTSTSTVIILSTSTSTLPQETNTFTEVITDTAYTTYFAPTSTIVVTEYSTTTSISISSGTTTIATSSGWLPAMSTIPNARAKKRQVSRIKKDVFDRAVYQICPEIVKGGEIKPSYVAAVTCYKLVQQFKAIILIKTARSTKTVTAATPTSTVYTTSTEVTVSTVPQVAASTTITQTQTETISSTITPSTTTTTTSTITATVIQATATAYAACSTSNIVGNVDGAGISNVAAYSPVTTATNGAANAYDCCVSCISNPNCAMSVFYDGFQINRKCTIVMPTSGQCTAPNQHIFEPVRDPAFPPNSGYLVSNGNCGSLK